MCGKQFIAVILTGSMILSSVALSSKTTWAADNQDSSSSSSEDFLSETLEKAKEVSGKAQESINNVTSNFNAFVSKIDTKEFERGWDTVANYASSGLGESLGKDYLQKVEDAITKLQENINSIGAGNSQSNAVEGGFIAEQWQADTYNINATAAGSKSSAERLGKNTRGSADVITSWGEDYSLKYYQTGEKSAREQAISIYDNYRQYYNKTVKNGGTPKSEKEYIDEMEASSELSDLYDSYYKGQKRLIPSDQMEEATEYLQRRIAKESVSETERKNLSKTAQETLDNLSDRITNAKEGISSEPLTENEAKAIAELSKDGSFYPSDFGVTTSQVIKPRYILKQAMSSGTSAAIIQAALSAGPDIYKILVDASEKGNVDEKELKKLGVDALLNGSEGFVEGSISDAILVAAKAGKLGSNMTNISSDSVGTLTVLTIDAARYGYQLSKGKITPVEYGDYMAEDVLVAVVSQSSGAALQTLLPLCPFAYFAGSMAGGILASTGYTFGKQALLDIENAGGFEAIVPKNCEEGIRIGQTIISTKKIKNQVSKFADMAVSMTKNGYIKVTQ